MKGFIICFVEGMNIYVNYVVNIFVYKFKIVIIFKGFSFVFLFINFEFIEL